jgi:hypothetical protein
MVLCLRNKVSDWENKFGKEVTRRVAIKNGTNAKKRLKIESKRVLKAENFSGWPTRSFKNKTNNVFNKMVQSYMVIMYGRKFYIELPGGWSRKSRTNIQKKKKNRVNLWRRLKNFIEAQWFYSWGWPTWYLKNRNKLCFFSKEQFTDFSCKFLVGSKKLITRRIVYK